MKLELTRRWLTAETTVGELRINDHFQCFILEDVYRPPGEEKVPAKTAIPCGTYYVKRTPSPKFGTLMPLLYNLTTKEGRLLVQNEGKTFEGIRIHPGNKADDTDGCLLTGTVYVKPNEVGQSVAAFRVVDALLAEAEARGETTTIEVKLGAGVRPAV